MGIYMDDNGVDISTHSMLKTFRRCPKQTEYKYIKRLKPQLLGRPLRLGTWMHRLEEIHGKGGDWQREHKVLTRQFNELFEEERDEIGDLPGDCLRLMQSYLWHYERDDWKVHENEFTLETTFPNGSIYRCKVDKLIENQYGLWLADHKWHRVIPDHNFRLLDAQSALYVWCAIRNKIPVQGFIWDYGRSKAPSIPSFTQTGIVSRWDRLDTDYPTAIKWFKENFPKGEIPDRYKPKLRMLKAQQYEVGAIQTSSFFQRMVIEKSPDMLKAVAQENYHTSLRMHQYDFTRAVERVVDNSCKFSCSYKEICALDLYGANTAPIIKRRFKVGDPQDYYQDRPEGYESGE